MAIPATRGKRLSVALPRPNVDYEQFVRPEAEFDLAEAYGYYQECRWGLGEDFILCVEEALERLNKNPHHYQEVHLQVRRALVHRFPYGIFYVVMENRIIVIAVLHEARNPARWQSRI